MTQDFWDRAQKGEQDYWASDMAKKYPEKRKDYWKQHLSVVRQHRPFQAGDRVLDVGCGPFGLITAVDGFCERYGVDSLIDFYREQNDMGEAIHYSKQMGETLDFEDEFFQVVTCINMLDHTRRPEAVWQEMWRVLKPGGLLLLEVDIFSGLRFYKKRLKRWWRVVRGRVEKHPYTFHMRHIDRAVKECGFKRLEQIFNGPSKRRSALLLLQK